MRVVILMSDTGGGHRAAATAVSRELMRLRPDADVTIVDALVEACPFPLNRAPAIYAFSMKHLRWLWGLCFYLSNGRRRAAISAACGWLSNGRGLKALLRKYPADLVISTHPLLTHQVERALRAIGHKAPFAVVVTDLVSGHWTWYSPNAHLHCVPTAEAKERMVRGGRAAERILVCGQPVPPVFPTLRAQRDALRQARGIDRPMILMLGGGDGVGNLGEFARSVAAAPLGAQVEVVCARNTKLRAELEGAQLGPHVRIHGFVNDLPELMVAADILVTKGGPGSIMEGCAAGTPMVIFDWIPGQEWGNVELALEHGFGCVATTPKAVVMELGRLLSDQALLQRMSASALSVSIPDSSARIAQAVLALVK
jgi:1,2-diacylglycerol 3-beta-galactosyltransferase